MPDTIRNKISESGIINIDISDFMPKNEATGIDLKDWLVDDLIIREHDFKEKLKCFNFESFRGANVFIHNLNYLNKINYAKYENLKYIQYKSPINEKFFWSICYLPLNGINCEKNFSYTWTGFSQERNS